MARFKFKFDTVLRHREVTEDERQRDLAKVMRQRMILMDQLKQMQQTITTSKHDLSGALVGTVDLDQVAAFTRYNAQSAERARSIVRELARLEKQLEIARARLLEATRARKAMELLRDRHHDRFVRELNRREIAELDDLTTQRFARVAMQVEVAE